MYKAPIVFARECDTLKTQLADASHGNRFLLMTDLATDHHTAKETTTVRDNLRFLLQLSLFMRYYTHVPIIQLDTTYTQYLSDENKLRYSAHDDVVQCLNLVRGFIHGGIGDINHYEDWIVEDNRRYKQSMADIGKCIRFIDTFSIRQTLSLDNYYVGHAANIVSYERNMTRNDSVSKQNYGCSSHFLWLEQLPDPLMVELLSHIKNPIGIVATDTLSPQMFLDTITKLNPSNEPGRITILVRMKKINTHLPPLIKKLGDRHYNNVLWCCDPICRHNLYLFMKIIQDHHLAMGGVWIHGRDVDTIYYVSKCLQSRPRRRSNQEWNKFSL